ncbi:adenylate kinase [Bdellovibrio sp. ZAP7]|uniref:adenylate kinase n=1 Tax=Bdellovibrio sp. ZAP7 TaxID=2231053 RepID=UPI001157FD8E|nr:adenylate kinase [Bdellovibrio sp. ZAP7]QDK45053.1 adenylate kinase [Bdellovibrio sp. ZAP7]
MTGAPRKIAVIGNAGAGKTVLSRRLAKLYQLPITHVDSIQFVEGMKIRPHKESITLLSDIQNQETWIIDGYGPLDIIQRRFQLADKIVLIDFPLWRHYWWATKRQIQNLWSPRKELPPGCSELSWEHTKKLYKTIGNVHRLMRPELLRILNREQQGKVVVIRNLSQLKRISQFGFGEGGL